MKQTRHPPEAEKHTIIQVVKSMLGELHALRNLSITTYASEEIYHRAIADIEREMSEYKQLLHKCHKGTTRAELFNELAFRRIIYRKNLMPNSICMPMFNVTFNADYIQRHKDAVKAHLIPFVAREVTALTRKDNIDIDAYMDALLDYFSKKTKRQEIVNFLTRKGIDNPHQLLNNIFHFATTGQTLKVYDQNSEYRARQSNFADNFFPEDDDVLFLNSINSDDVEVIGESEAAATRRNQHRSNTNNHFRIGPMSANNSLLFSNQQAGPSSGNSSNNPASNDHIDRLRQLLNDHNHMDMVFDLGGNFNIFRDLSSDLQPQPPRDQQQQQPQTANGLPYSYFYRPPFPRAFDQNASSSSSRQTPATHFIPPPPPPFQPRIHDGDNASTSRDHPKRSNGWENVSEEVLDNSDDNVQVVAEYGKRRRRENNNHNFDNHEHVNMNEDDDDEDDLQLIEEVSDDS